jgi:glycosidase
MESRKLSRHGFLRLCALAAGGAVLGACEGVLPDVPAPAPTAATATLPLTTATPSPSPIPQASAEIAIQTGDGDAWTWIKQVHGKAGGLSENQEVLLDVNGLEYPAERQGESFFADIPLGEGENRVVAICRPVGQQNGESGELRSNVVHFQERLRNVPVARISIAVDGERVVLDSEKSSPEIENGAPIVDHIWSVRAGNPGPLQIQGVTGLEGREMAGEVSSQTMVVVPPPIDGEYYLNLRVKDQASREDTSTIYFVVADGKPRLPDFDKENPAWAESAIVYGVVPFLFGSPAFQAIIKRLGDLADLGVNALWLGPVNRHPADDYGYAVEDYFELDPAYGTKEDFHRLVQAAHTRGIRILMDFVPSHTSDTHPYLLDTEARGRESNYWDYYERDAQGNYTYYFNYANLPTLNYDNPEVRRMIVEAFSYWVREFDVDGFRVDFAWAIRERRPDFWPEWRRELKRIKPDLLLLAEASARDPYYFENGFDAAYDWTGAVGSWAWETVWNTYKHRLLSYNLGYALTNRPDGYHPDALIFRFLNNNDTGERFITKYGEGFVRAATALLLTLPGIPCIYTGDEYGLEFEPYQELTPLTWRERFPGLRAYHQQLVALRKEHPSLRSRLWTSLIFDPVPQEVYGYVRYLEGNEQPVLVLLNFSEKPAEIKFELPGLSARILAEG